MQTIEIKNKKWTVGLEWEILPGEASFKEEAKEIAEKTSSNFGVVIEHDGQFSIGLSKKVNPKNPSANLYLALANQEKRMSDSNNYYPDWIVVEEVGDDKYWMAIIKNGIPTPQSDAILDITTVKDRIIDLLVNDTFTIYSTCIEIKALFDGQKEIIETDLNELTAEVNTKIKFMKLRGIPDSVIKAGVGLAAICILLYGGYTIMDGRDLAEKQRLFQEKQQEEQKKKEEEYQKALDAWKVQVEQNEKIAKSNIKLAMRVNPAGIVSAWYNLVGGIETGTHGWALGKIECYVDDKTESQKPEASCDILFNRTGLSTNRMFLQDYPDAILKGDQALVKKKVVIEDKFISEPNDSLVSSLYKAKNWGFDMISQLQLLKIVNIENEIKPSASITYTLPAKPLSPVEQQSGQKSNVEEQKTIGYAKGQITIKNDNFELMKEVVDNVDFKGVSVRKATFEPKSLGEINWTIQLDYYVQEDSSGGIAGSDSSNLSNSALPQSANQKNEQK